MRACRLTAGLAKTGAESVFITVLDSGSGSARGSAFGSAAYYIKGVIR